MKTPLLLLLCAALCLHPAAAQKIANDKVPPAVLSSFKAKFPTATKAKWEMESKTEFEVNFRLDGKEVSANFALSGQWLETETEIKVSNLPAAIRSVLSTDFEGYDIEEASQIESLKNGNCFEAEIEKGGDAFDVLLTADGKIISKTRVVE